MDIYDRIDGLLKERRMSRRKLALAADIPPTTLNSMFTRKNKKISFDVVSKIAAVLDVSASELAGDAQLGDLLQQDDDMVALQQEMYREYYRQNGEEWPLDDNATTQEISELFGGMKDTSILEFMGDVYGLFAKYEEHFGFTPIKTAEQIMQIAVQMDELDKQVKDGDPNET